MLENFRRRRSYKRKSAPIVKPIPRENIEYVKNVKTDHETRKEAAALKTGMIVVIIMVVLVLISVVIFAVFQMKNGQSIKWAWLDEFLGRTSESKSETSDISSGGVSLVSGAEDDSYLLVLANKNNELPADFSPQITTFNNIQIDKRAVSDLSDMISAADNAGVKLTLSKGYITPDDQTGIYTQKYNEFVAAGYSKAKAEEAAVIYKSGRSDSNTGLSITFSGEDFKNSAAFAWLTQNSINYGFVLRFPENKVSKTGVEFSPNTFRYVGKENAVKMRQLSMCLEEYAVYVSAK